MESAARINPMSDDTKEGMVVGRAPEVEGKVNDICPLKAFLDHSFCVGKPLQDAAFNSRSTVGQGLPNCSMTGDLTRG